MPPGAYVSPRLSPDGTRVALEVRDPTPDIWVWDLARQTQTRLTFNVGGMAPIWTPDGARIVFGSSGTVDRVNLYVRAADGTGTDTRWTPSENIQVPSSVTPDGTFVVAVERRPQTGSDVVRVTLDAGGAGPHGVESLVETPFTEQNGEVSPDGRFLAYESNESGRFEIYARPYPEVANGRWQVSTGGGTRPSWTREGRELVYLDSSNHLTAVPVETTGSTFRAGTPAILSTTAYAATVAWRTYDVSPDGRRFLVLKESASQTAPPPTFVVVQNWFEELKAKVP